QFSIRGLCHQHGSGRCEGYRRQRMTGQSMCELRDDIRCRRCDEEKTGAISQLDMSRSPVFLFLKEARGDWILRKSLKGKWRDKFNRIACHHDENVVSLFDEQTCQLSRLVGDRKSVV